MPRRLERRLQLAAVKATGTDDSDKLPAQMRATQVNDMDTKGGWIRPDGTMVHDTYLMRVKTPAASKGPRGCYDVVEVIRGEAAWTTKAESTCPLWK